LSIFHGQYDQKQDATNIGGSGRNGFWRSAYEACGQPAGVAAADVLYVITGKYAAEKNAKLIEFVNKTVQVKGTVTEKNGQKMIDASSITVAK
jgi:hypothetical protein